MSGQAGDEANPPSSPRAVRRRRAGDSGGPSSTRVPVKLEPPRKPPSAWLRWLGLMLMAALLGAGLAWALGYWPPGNAALPPPAAPPVPVRPVAPARPALYLPPPGKGKALPRLYSDDRLGEPAATLGKRHKAMAAVKGELDFERLVADPLVRSVGYALASSAACRILVSYRPDCPYDDRAALEQARSVYGTPAGHYLYRSGALHSVTYWEDEQTLLKIDCAQEGADRRLSRLEILDRMGSVTRAIQQPRRTLGPAPRTAPETAPVSLATSSQSTAASSVATSSKAIPPALATQLLRDALVPRPRSTTATK